MEHSEWATPIVSVVVKQNGSIHIYGDFKVSVNPELIVSSTRHRGYIYLFGWRETFFQTRPAPSLPLNGGRQRVEEIFDN